MKLIINASNVHVGGMLQVAISFINELVYFPGNEYHIFLSAEVESQISGKGFPDNFSFYSFLAFSGEPGGVKKRWLSYRRLSRLKLLERVIKPDVVFTVFGPTFWKPSAPHIAGFAIPFFVYRDSPYFNVISKVELLKRNFVNLVKEWLFTRYVDYLVVETEEVRQRLISIFKIDEKRIFQVHNTYSNIYNHPAQWSDRIKLPERLKGELRLVTISANHRYKNLEIINRVIDELKALEPDLRVKFILTIRKEQFDGLQPSNRKSVHFTDRINVEDCPHLYRQCDFMFLPSLLDCFSASYPEAMKLAYLYLPPIFPLPVMCAVKRQCISIRWMPEILQRKFYCCIMILCFRQGWSPTESANCLNSGPPAKGQPVIFNWQLKQPGARCQKDCIRKLKSQFYRSVIP